MKKNEVKAIEDSFPIKWIRTLAFFEQQNQRYLQSCLKWFKSSPVLSRAILLAANKSSNIQLVEEFYKNHSTDGDLHNKIILDPFMGFGSILAEAVRLNMEPIGIENNPVAWFFAKTLLEPANKESLEAAYARLSKQEGVDGVLLTDALLSYYKTECPCCNSVGEKADIIHTFWIQTAICANDKCQKRVPLFDDLIIFQKIISIKFYSDYSCPKCNHKFDWEIEPASWIAEKQRMINSPGDSAGIGRGNRHWAYGESKIACPRCGESIKSEKTSIRPKQKKIPITVLLCPHCQAVWQYRGSLPQSVRCPVCGSSYYPRNGNIQRRDWYICPFCGTMDKISTSYLQLSNNQRLPIFPYAIEGRCPQCQPRRTSKTASKKSEINQEHQCLLWKNNGRFFKRIESNDLSQYLSCYQTWNKYQTELPAPDSEIPESKETRRLIENKYFYWIELFNARQLLSLSSLLKGIHNEQDEICRNQLLLAFLLTLETNNLFTTYHRKRFKVEGIFSKPDFRFPFGYVENNVWGWQNEEGTFQYFFSQILENAEFMKQPFDWHLKGQQVKKHISGETLMPEVKPKIWCSNLSSLVSQDFLKKADLIVTELSGGKDEHFAEWADFYYVWLKLILKQVHSFFDSKYSQRIKELDRSHRKRKHDQFYWGELKNILAKCGDLLKSEGLFILLFTYQNEKTGLRFLNTILDTGYSIESILPVHLALDDAKTDDSSNPLRLVHICRFRGFDQKKMELNWQQIHQNIRAEIANEIERIHQNKYGSEPLTPMEIQWLLLGRSLKYFSEIYLHLALDEQSIFMLERIFIKIRIAIDQALNSDLQLPEELLDIEAESYIYFAYLAALYEINASQFQRATKNIKKAESLIKAGLIRADKSRGENVYKVIHPLDRFDQLSQKFQTNINKHPQQQALFNFVREDGRIGEPLLVDKIHYLMGLALYDENLSPWLNRWQADLNQIRVGCLYLKRQNQELSELADKVLEKFETLE